MIQQILDKQNVTIVVTDSGLGGLSIAADLVKRLNNIKIFRQADIIFFNSSFDKSSGYNKIESNNEKIDIFNRALNSMYNRYSPDLIVIACNTLSLLYDETPFSKIHNIPTLGIVEASANLIYQEIKNIPNAYIIIFAAKTTIEQGVHKNMLTKRGISSNQIIDIACPNLADEIEEGTQSSTTRNLVNQYVENAVAKLDNLNQPFFASLNCTHYGYIQDLFQETFKAHNVKPQKIINPNLHMLDFLHQMKNRQSYEKSIVTAKVVSKTEIYPHSIQILSKLISPISKQMAIALQNYELDPKLF